MISLVRTSGKKTVLFLCCWTLLGSSCGGGGATPVAQAPEPWRPVEPHRERIGEFTVVWLAGEPHDMGFQHGTLLRDEILEGVRWLDEQVPLPVLLFLTRVLGIRDLALARSYPEVLEECRGMAAAIPESPELEDVCVLLNFGDVLLEFLDSGFPGWLAGVGSSVRPGCSQFAAAGPATPDGRLVHGRSLDNDGGMIPFFADYPVLFIRQPAAGLPHVLSAFPGAFWGNSGMNAAGITIASNDADPLDPNQQNPEGRSTCQMMMRVMERARRFQDVLDYVEEEPHLVVKIFLAADGPGRRAGVLEMAGPAVGVRELEQGVVYTSNHFTAPETAPLHANPPSESSQVRFARLGQLLDPGGRDTLHGRVDRTAAVAILRDRVDPWLEDGTGRPLEYSRDVFDNNRSIATNGVIRQVVFDPERLLMWVAAGREPPIPSRPFVCYSLGERLGLPGAAPCEPAFYPAEP